MRTRNMIIAIGAAVGIAAAAGLNLAHGTVWCFIRYGGGC